MKLLWNLGLACMVTEAVNGKLKPVYKIWKYDSVDDYKERPIDYFLERIANKTPIKNIILKIRYRNLNRSYQKKIMYLRNLFGMKRYEKTQEQIINESFIYSQEETERKLTDIINRHYKRLKETNYENGKFKMSYTDIPKLIDIYLQDLTTDRKDYIDKL